MVFCPRCGIFNESMERDNRYIFYPEDFITVAKNIAAKYANDKIALDIIGAATHEYTKWSSGRTTTFFEIDLKRSLAIYDSGKSLYEVVEYSYFLQIRNSYRFATKELEDAVIQWRFADANIGKKIRHL